MSKFNFFLFLFFFFYGEKIIDCNVLLLKILQLVFFFSFFFIRNSSSLFFINDTGIYKFKGWKSNVQPCQIIVFEGYNEIWNIYDRIISNPNFLLIDLLLKTKAHSTNSIYSWKSLFLWFVFCLHDSICWFCSISGWMCLIWTHIWGPFNLWLNKGQSMWHKYGGTTLELGDTKARKFKP